MRNAAGRFKRIEAMIAAIPRGEHWGASVRRTAGNYFVALCAELGITSPIDPQNVSAREWEAMATRHQQQLATFVQQLATARGT